MADINQFETDRLRAIRNIPRPTGDLGFVDNFANSWMLDTGPGAAIQYGLAAYRNGVDLNDVYDPITHEYIGDPSYNVFRDDDLSGYESHYDAFVGVRTREETAAIKELIDINSARREDLYNNNASWSRLLANVVDPVNIIPVPLAKGIGFVAGARRGAFGVGAALGGEELLRHNLDPTSTVEETAFNMTFGALFGGALGGLFGRVGAKRVHMTGDQWAEFNNAVDAMNRVAGDDPHAMSGIRPMDDPEFIMATPEQVVARKAFRGMKDETNLAGWVEDGDTPGISKIYLNEDGMRGMWEARSWEKRNNLGGGSFAFPEDAFKTFEEFVEFTKRHETAHHYFDRHANETQRAYENRIDSIAYDTAKFNDYVSIARSYNPNRLVATGIAEHIRWTQHPWFMLKNNKFGGFIGNEFAAFADEMSGAFGLMNKGNQAETSTRNSIHILAKQHAPLFVEARRGLWDAYLMSIGKDPKLANTSPTAQALSHLGELVRGRGNVYGEFVRKVTSVYLGAAESTDAAVLHGVQAMDRYYTEMGKRIKEVGAFNTKSIEKSIEWHEKLLAERQAQLQKYRSVFEDISKNLNRSNKRNEATLTRQVETIADQNEALDSLRQVERMTEKQFHYRNRLSERLIPEQEARIKDTQARLERIRTMLDDPSKIPLDERGLTGMSAKQVEWYRKLYDEVIPNYEARIEAIQNRIDGLRAAMADPENLPALDPSAKGHFHRIWKRGVVEEHRDILEGILMRHFEEGRGKLERVQDTVDNILKVGKIGSIMRRLREDMEGVGASDLAIQAYERELKALSRKRENGVRLTMQDRLEEAERIVHKAVKTYGLGTGAAMRVKEVMDEIAELSANPGAEIYGSAPGLLSRRLDLPSKLFVDLPELNGGSFIETDPETVMRIYHRRMSVAIEAARRYGDVSMESRLDELFSASERAIDAEADPAKRLGMLQEQKLQMQAAIDLRDKIIGIYGIPENPDGIGPRAAMFAKNWMVMALMGKAVVAALADIGRIMMAVGAEDFFKGFGDGLMAKTQEFIRAGHEVEMAGEAAEMALHGRFEAIMDLEQYYTGVSTVEKYAERGANAMFLLNGLSPYTDLMKRWAGGIIQSQMIEASIKWARHGRRIEESAGGGVALRHGNYESFLKEAEQLGMAADEIASATGIRTKADFEKVLEQEIQQYVEAPAQNLIRKIIREGGSPISSNAFGPGRLGVEYTDAAGTAQFAELSRVSGALTKRERETLLRLGIDLHMAKRIAEQWEGSGKVGPGNGTNKLFLANTDAWTDPEVVRAFRAALAEEVNNAVITPTPGDKLNFMSTPLGSVLAQFKSFGMSATNRTLLAGIQQKDAQALQGIMAMIAMGAVVDMIRSGPYDDRPLLSLDRLVQAVDYSGVTGIMFDLNNMMEMTSGAVLDQPLGIRPLLGIDPTFGDATAARALGQVGGPSFGVLINLVNSFVSEDAETADKVRAVRRLVPFNQLIWWSALVDRLQRDTVSALED